MNFSCLKERFKLIFNYLCVYVQDNVFVIKLQFWCLAQNLTKMNKNRAKSCLFYFDFYWTWISLELATLRATPLGLVCHCTCATVHEVVVPSADRLLEVTSPKSARKWRLSLSRSKSLICAETKPKEKNLYDFNREIRVYITVII